MNRKIKLETFLGMDGNNALEELNAFVSSMPKQDVLNVQHSSNGAGGTMITLIYWKYEKEKTTGG